MNGFERYQAALAGQPMDFLPRLPILMAFVARFIGSNYGRFASDYRVLAEANLNCANYFSFDQLSAISDPYRETQGFGAEILFVEDAVPRCVTPPLESNKNLEQLLSPDPKQSERMRDRLQGVETMHREGGGRFSVMGWIEGPAAEAANLRGVTNFLMDLMMDPDYAGELMDLCVAAGIAFAQAQIEAGADTIGIGDAIASQVSPDMYGEYIFPREKALVDAIHVAGGWARLHICGDTTHLLPWFAQLGCDIIDLDWQVDLTLARRILGPDQVIVTNLDPVREVMDAKPKAIGKRLQQLYEKVGNRLMVGAGCEIPQDTPPANLKALCTPVPWRASEEE
jgi:MtaA/CmuA family methyltransferase